MNTLAATIIIPVFDRTQEVSHLLGQLTRQTRLDFEVIVVDDGSTPPIERADLPADPPYSLRLLRHEARQGVGKARNTALREATADLLIFVDSDGDITDEHWLEKHIALRITGKDLAQKNGNTLFVLHSEVKGINASYWGRVDTYSNWFGSSMKRPCIVRDRHVPTHNTSAPREVFKRVGLFEESLEVCEDIEWCFRCMEQGVPLLFLPGAPLGHHDRNRFRDVWRHYYRFGLFALSVRKKRPSSPYQWLYPKGLVSAIVLFLPITALMTLYVAWYWLPGNPGVLVHLPGMYLANVANYAGLMKSLLNR